MLETGRAPSGNPEAGSVETGHAETGRLEALSDGVFAVAITLLALGLATPHTSDGRPVLHLAAALLDKWPAFLAYALSFLTILIMWVNHHTLFRVVQRTDHQFLLLNGLLLLIVTAIPFATDLLATYLLTHEWGVAQVIYSGLSLAMALTYYAMWAYASRGRRLLDRNVNEELARSITDAYRFGPALYIVAFALAFVSPPLSLTVCIFLAVYFALPGTVTGRLASAGAARLRAARRRRAPEP